MKFSFLHEKTGNLPSDHFTNLHYQKHNIARLKHLDSLNLDFQNKRILEFGAGIGDHTYYLLIKGAKVYATEGRKELLDILKSKYPVECEQLDAEKDLKRIVQLKGFDIVYCYGFLYHLSNPSIFLESIKDIADVLLLETCVSGDYMQDGEFIVKEDSTNLTQALHGKGCRPTRNWIYSKLKQNYNFVYTPKSQPDHPEFPKDWNFSHNDKVSENIRAIFIASKHRISNDKLQEGLPKIFS